MRILGNSVNRRINPTLVGYINSGGNAYSAEFHPTTNHVCGGGAMSSKQVIVYSWNGLGTLTEVATYNTGTSSLVPGVRWHPGGSFLSSTEYNDNTYSLAVYSWNGSAISRVAYAGITGGSARHSWHPDGDFVVTANYSTTVSVRVYSWNGVDTLTSVTTKNLGVNAYFVTWSPSGTYVAVGSPLSSKQLCIYSWNGTDTLTEVASYDNGAGYVSDIYFTSDEAHVVCTSTYDVGMTHSLMGFAFSGSALTLKDSVDFGGTTTGYMGFSSNRYVAAGKTYGSAASQEILKMYEWNSTTEAFTAYGGYTANARGIASGGFSKNGRYYVAPVLDDSSSYSFRVFNVFTRA